jgi:hypothetical protein
MSIVISDASCLILFTNIGLIEVDEKFIEVLNREGFRLSPRLKSLLLRTD